MFEGFFLVRFVSVSFLNKLVNVEAWLYKVMSVSYCIISSKSRICSFVCCFKNIHSFDITKKNYNYNSFLAVFFVVE